MGMTYEEARKFINNSNQYGCVPGLTTVTELLQRLDNPQEKLNIIHVAGTNGKGSTSSFITGILNKAGYRVGRYISPAVFTYRERIQISDGDRQKNSLPMQDGEESQASVQATDRNRQQNSVQILDGDRRQASLQTPVHENEQQKISAQYITKQGVCDTIALIKPVCEAMAADGFSHPTSFEIETAMVMLYLLWMKVDFAVIEVGMGGRLDATNVIKHPVCSVITSISMDHMQYLGNTLEKIASEKAGIIKKQAPVITCQQKPEVDTVIRDTAKHLASPLFISDYAYVSDVNYKMDKTEFSLIKNGRSEQYTIRLLGEYQIENAVLAVKTAQVLKSLGFTIEEEDIRKGLSQTRWSGRFEIIAANPCFIIDGAHNEAAASLLRSSIIRYFKKKRKIFLIGVFADKEYEKILKLTADLADVIITLTPENPRALPSDQLAKEALRYCDKVYDAKNTENAVKLAYREAAKEDIIIAFGSLSYLGDLVDTLGIRKDDTI